jgi:hypothetical protein
MRGPLPELDAVCDTQPAANPVKFVPRMKHACERLGLVTEARGRQGLWIRVRGVGHRV